IFAEGLVRLVDLPNDYYRLEESHQRLYGRRTRRIFALGDLVRVKVAHVDIRRRHVNLVLAEEEEVEGEGVGEKGETGKRRKGRGRGEKGKREKGQPE
ncbi:MAG TPA: hypothetical protein VE082_07530, partial [Desulfobaccales bacterium]|nr:hypothetical protein [Desulfobaccales bacterium]